MTLTLRIICFWVAASQASRAALCLGGAHHFENWEFVCCFYWCKTKNLSPFGSQSATGTVPFGRSPTLWARTMLLTPKVSLKACPWSPRVAACQLAQARSFQQFKALFDNSTARFTLGVSCTNGLFKLTSGKKVCLTNGRLFLRGLDDNKGGAWPYVGDYMDDCPVAFWKRKLQVHLDQLLSSNNLVDKPLSSHLAMVGFGSLVHETITKSKVLILDLNGDSLDNHDVPIRGCLDRRWRRLAAHKTVSP